MKILYRLLVVISLVCAGFLALLSVNPLLAYADTCASHANKQCISNIVYWYDSCGALEDIYQNCNTTNQICQNAQCVNKAPVTPPPATTGQVKSCYNGDIHWFNSNGTVGAIYQSCKDANSCTLDDCAGNQCVNELKCDGSTCLQSSQDYIVYCGGAQNTTQPPVQPQIQNQSLSISLFGKKDSMAPDWQRSISLAAGDKVDFLIIVKNNSNTPADSIIVKTDLTSAISYAGDLKIGNLASAGNIASGIDLGTLAPKSSQIISFTGMLANQVPDGALQVGASVNASSVLYDSDYLMVAAPAAVAGASVVSAENSFVTRFKKNWYIWLVVILVLIVVFIIIFRRLGAKA